MVYFGTYVLTGDMRHEEEAQLVEGEKVKGLEDALQYQPPSEVVWPIGTRVSKPLTVSPKQPSKRVIWPIGKRVPKPLVASPKQPAKKEIWPIGKPVPKLLKAIPKRWL